MADATEAEPSANWADLMEEEEEEEDWGEVFPNPVSISSEFEQMREASRLAKEARERVERERKAKEAEEARRKREEERLMTRKQADEWQKTANCDGLSRTLMSEVSRRLQKEGYRFRWAIKTDREDIFRYDHTKYTYKKIPVVENKWGDFALFAREKPVNGKPTNPPTSARTHPGNMETPPS